MDDKFVLPNSLTPEQKKVILAGLLISRIKNAVELLMVQTSDPAAQKELLMDVNALIQKYSAKLTDQQQADIETVLDSLDKKTLTSVFKAMIDKKVAGEDIRAFVTKLES